MIFKGDEYDDIEGILEGWWSYFTDLFGNSDQGNDFTLYFGMEALPA
jgi:hypothetical protein